MQINIKPKSSNSEFESSQFGAGELLRLRKVVAITATSASTIFRWVNIGRFPSPIKINGCTRWRLSEIEAFLDEAATRRTK